MTKREVVSTQQSAPVPQPITSGHTTLTFSSPSKTQREETYINKVYQQNDASPPRKVLDE